MPYVYVTRQVHTRVIFPKRFRQRGNLFGVNGVFNGEQTKIAIHH